MVKSQKSPNKLLPKIDHWSVKNKILRLLFLVTLSLFVPFFVCANDGIKQNRRFGIYEVKLAQDFKTGIGKLIIFRGRDKVYEESDFDSHYSGHFQQALKLADEVWPQGKIGLSKFKQEFKEELEHSLYWKSF